MPIKRLQRSDAVFPRIGILRKGAAKSGNKPGADLSYFRFDTDDADAAQSFAKAYGAEPRQINIYLPYDSAEENFQVWQEAYVAGGLKHRCDGEVCTIWQKPDGTYSQEPVPCPGGCKEVGRLAVIIPELARMAYVTVETHSINDILQLTSNLQAAQAMRGTLKGMPLTLTRRPQEISTPTADGKRARRTKWLLFLEPHPDWVRVQLEVMHRRALSVGDDYIAPVAPLRQLTDGRTVDVGTGEILDDEDVIDTTPDVYEVEEIIPDDVVNWLNQASPVDAAKAWAIDTGACGNEHEAKNSLKKIVDTHGGRLNKSNLNEVLIAFHDRQLEKLAEMAADVEAEADEDEAVDVPFDTDPEPAF